MASLPDPQKVYLEALRERASEVYGGEMLAELVHGEPVSHVFGPEPDGEPYGGYDDPEEYLAVVREVGARDLYEKIRYWERWITDSETVNAELATD